MPATAGGGAAPGRPAAPLDLATDSRVRRLPSQGPAHGHGHRHGRATGGQPSRPIRIVLAIIAALAVLAPAAVVRFGPVRHLPYQLLVAIPGRVIPLAELPPVEPVAIRSLDPDAARAYNAAIPFSTDPNPAARPFRPAGGADDLARATDCLAAAVYYEAGEDPAGQRAVAQVVLNRVRHPAFPKTVCGVVFQGSERPTGCQFTFTCDGSLLRYTPTPAGWARARAIAAAALAGTVDPVVGQATHYHTDWVVPYWLASLDKIVAVHSQLFYRWTGWWGTPPAFDRHAEATEPGIAALARLSEAHRTGGPAAASAPATWADDPLTDPAAPATPAGTLAGGQFLVTLPPALPPARWPDHAAQLCGTRDRCTVMAWRDKAHTAATLPLEPAQVAAMTFSYVRDRAAGLDRPLWNCADARRADPRQCMKRQMLMTGTPVAGEAATPGPAPAMIPAPPPDLPGVRRKADAGLPIPAPATAP